VRQTLDVLHAGGERPVADAQPHLVGRLTRPREQPREIVSGRPVYYRRERMIGVELDVTDVVPITHLCHPRCRHAIRRYAHVIRTIATPKPSESCRP
jgi:hypothetical protein